MSREKLEVIKEKYQVKRLNGRTSVLSVNPTELDWLIKQAERAQELEELNRILSSDKSMFIEELVREQQQNKRYREALKEIVDSTMAIKDYKEHSFHSERVAIKALEAEK